MEELLVIRIQFAEDKEIRRMITAYKARSGRYEI